MGNFQEHFQLSLEQVSRSFGDRKVIASVSAAVSTGQIMVITGPNGSGKSTLVKMAAKLLRPSAGRVVWSLNDHEVGADASRRLVGMVSPDLTLYNELTAVENLLFFAHARGVPKGRDEAVAALDRLGLAGRGDDLVGAYSSGMKQRLKYAFALLHGPKLLFLDEPTANLDEQGSRTVFDTLMIARETMCVVIATNEPEEVHWGDFVVELGS